MTENASLVKPTFLTGVVAICFRSVRAAFSSMCSVSVILLGEQTGEEILLVLNTYSTVPRHCAAPHCSTIFMRTDYSQL